MMNIILQRSSEPVLPKIILFSQINIQGLMKRTDIDPTLKLLQEKLDKISKRLQSFGERNSEVKSTYSLILFYSNGCS